MKVDSWENSWWWGRGVLISYWTGEMKTKAVVHNKKLISFRIGPDRFMALPGRFPSREIYNPRPEIWKLWVWLMREPTLELWSFFLFF